MFAWELPAEAVRPSMTYRIELLENSATVIDASTDGATFPVAGPSDLGITADAMKMKVVLIPVVTPEGGVQMTDPLRQIFEERLIATYPLQELEIVVREPWVNSARLSNLDAAFNFMAQARAEDGAGHETYYHLVADNDTCCTGADFEGWAGIANLSDASNLAERDGISKIYVDWPEYWEVDAEVMIHEIGHNHGRDHAPCGDPGGPDPDYPYAGAVIGVTGYDIHKGTLMYAGVPDAEYGMELTDFMSYCWPNWWSDYTWQALVERVRLMTQAASAGAPAPWNREILRGVVHADGTVTWSRVPARGGEATAAVQTVADGVMTMRGADGGALAEAAVFARPLADTDVTILEADVTAAPSFDRFEVDLVVGRHVEAYAAAITTVSAVARR
jgi:hypothetical protein